MILSDNKVSSFISHFKNELLKIYEDREVDSIVNIIFQHLFGWDKIELRMNRSVELSEVDIERLNLVLNRLKQSEPIQYILGETEFYGLKFKVDSSVLIPRQETEELVDLIIKETPSKPIRILEIGSGSGCIPIALKKHLPEAEIVSVDISESAISTAKKNAELNKVEVSFLTCDVFFDDILDLGKFDIVVSNPPYIDKLEESEMKSNVLSYEPHNALFVESDALEFYERILHVSKQVLNKGGKVYFELNENYESLYTSLFLKNEFKFNFINDLNGKLRMVKLSI